MKRSFWLRGYRIFVEKSESNSSYLEALNDMRIDVLSSEGLKLCEQYPQFLMFFILCLELGNDFFVGALGQ